MSCFVLIFFVLLVVLVLVLVLVLVQLEFRFLCDAGSCEGSPDSSKWMNFGRVSKGGGVGFLVQFLQSWCWC